MVCDLSEHEEQDEHSKDQDGEDEGRPLARAENREARGEASRDPESPRAEGRSC